MAFGDGYTDPELLAQADYSFAIRNVDRMTPGH
ncbi:hypothetical protein [Klebsiella oxytoca]